MTDTRVPPEAPPADLWMDEPFAEDPVSPFDALFDTPGFSDAPAGAICETCPKPLVIFIGGAADTITEMLKKVYRHYEGEFEHTLKRQDVSYYSHLGWEGAANVARNTYKRHKETVIFIGHSWGGDSSLKAIRKLEKNGIKVKLWVTLDPVSRFNKVAKPSNVERWVNVYVNYEKAKRPRSLLDGYFANVIASVGGPWQRVEAADFNLEYNYYGEDAHAHAWEMFQLVRHEVEKFW